MNQNSTRKPVDLAKWKYYGQRALALVNEIDVYEIEAEAGEEIWRSMQWWGRPDSRGDHVRTCPCADCT